MMREISGIAISPGITLAKAFVYMDDIVYTPSYQIAENSIDTEYQRFDQAIHKAKQELQDFLQHEDEHSDSSKLLKAHLLMLDDPQMTEQVKISVREKLLNIEAVFVDYMDSMISKLTKSSNSLIRERVADFVDIKQRLLNQLLNKKNSSNLIDLEKNNGPVIIVAHDLLPITTMQLKKDKVCGLLLEAGGKTGHTAILARTMGIPAIFDVHQAVTFIKNNDELILDGEQGIAYLNPDESTKIRYGKLINEQRLHQASLDNLANLPAKTLDNYCVSLKSNAQQIDDIAFGMSQNSDGIGLFRSEFLFLLHSMKHLPTEEEQFSDYKKAIELCGDKPITIRTLDIGGDKILDQSYHVNEENPLLGWRALRFCLAEKEIFKTQLRALYRASAFGHLRIMLPFVTGYDDLYQALLILKEVREELSREKIDFNPKVPIGIMIEIPSAALVSDELASMVDFFSIGTNDLTQYTLAVDRSNEKAAPIYQPLHPAVLRLIRMTIESAQRHQISCSICGELAGDLLAIPLLLGLGLNQLSVSPSHLMAAKETIRKLHYTQTLELAREVMTMKTENEVITYLKRFREEHIE